MISQWAGQRGALEASLLGPGLPPLWTFTRASNGTYLPTSATLATAATDVARFDALGYLNEPAATNLLLRSQLIGGASWSNNQNLATYAVTTNNAVAPDGTTTATRVVASAIGVGGWAFTAQAVTSTAAAYSRAVWLKGAVGGETVYLMSTLGASAYTKTTCVLTTSWQRFTLNNVTETALSWYTYIGCDRRDVTQADPGAITYYVWQAGDELGAFATSDIATVAATATRAADNLTLDLTQLPGLQTAGGYSFALDFSLFNNLYSARYLGMAGAGGFSNCWYFGDDGAGNLRLTTIVATVGQTSVSATLRTAGLTNRLAGTVTPAGITFNLNGAGDVTVANAGMPVMTSLSVGKNPWDALGQQAMHATLVTLVPGPQSAAWRAARAY